MADRRIEECDLIRRWYPEYRFGGFTDIDGTLAFYTRIHSLIEPSDVVLDIGCGRGAGSDDPVQVRREARWLRRRCARVIGIDIDRAGSVNPQIDEFRLIAGPEWPIDDASIDVAFADFVLEHVEDPQRFFAECERVVRPGGYLCIRTPNIRSYFGLAGRIVPSAFHRDVLKIVQPHRRPEDVFPTAYKANTRRRLSRLLREHGFDGTVYGYEAEPSYVPMRRWLLYSLAVWHARFAPNAFKVCLFAFARRVNNYHVATADGASAGPPPGRSEASFVDVESSGGGREA